MLSLALIIPIRSNSPFPPLFCYGEESPKWEEAKERRPVEPAVRSIYGGKEDTPRVPSQIDGMAVSPVSFSPSYPLCLMTTIVATIDGGIFAR